MALTKVSGGILDPGINVAGIVTATGFDGPFTGGSSKNITAGIITATGFDLNGNGDISGDLVIGGNLTANGDFTTLNTTLREVELLRVDADTTATAAIITQTGSGDIFRAFDASTQVFKIADGGDVGIARSIFHLNDIDTTIGFPAANQVKITAANEEVATFTDSAAAFNKKIQLRSSAVIDQEVSESSATVPTLRIRNTATHTLASFQNTNTTSTIFQWNDYGSSTTAGNLIFRSSNSGNEEFARITGAGNVGIGTNNPLNKFEVYGTDAAVTLLNYGQSSGGLAAWTSGRLAFVSAHTNDDLVFGYSNSTLSVDNFVERMRIDNGNGYVGINTDFTGSQTWRNGQRLEIFGGGGNVTGELHLGANRGDSNQSVGSINFFDNSQDSTHRHIALIEADKTGSTSNKRGGDLIFFTKKDNTAAPDEKVRITSAGHLGVGDDSPDTRLSVKAASGTDVVGKFTSTDANAWIQFRDNTTTDTAVMVGANGDNLLFRAGSNTRWKIDSSGHLLPGAVGSYNIGSTGAEIGNVYLADSKNIYIGSDQDVYFNHSGVHAQIKNTTGNFYFDTELAHYIRLGSGNEAAITATHNSSVDLYYDGGTYTTPKLKTSATGITVDGEVASTQDYPNFRPTLDLNFAAEKKLDPRITYQRTGPASYYTEFGLLKVVGDNAPRFDYDPVTRESKGLLIEESRTNAKTYSQDFSTGWNISGVADYRGNNDTSIETPEGITDGVGVMPLIEGSGGAVHQFYSATTTQVTKYITYSVFAKPNGRNHIQHQDGPFVHDLVNGTTSGSATGEYVSATTTKLANGWCRCTMTRNHSNSYDQFNLKLHNGSGASYSGDGSSGVYIWGVQQEDGAFATSYIPTNGAAATRGADTTVIDGEEFTEFFDHDGIDTNDYQGTLISFVELDSSTTPSAGRYNKIQLEMNNDNKISFAQMGGGTPYIHGIISYGGSIQIDGGSSGSTFPTVLKQGLAFAKNNAAFCYNGNTVHTDNSVNVGHPSFKYTQLTIGGSPSKAHLKKITYYNSRISDTQLRNLTS